MRKIPREEIEKLLKELKGNIGVYINLLETGEVYTYNADERFPAASVINFAMLLLLMQDVNDGKIDWNKKIEITENNRIGGTGVLPLLEDDYKPTIAQMANFMITLNDNRATNQLMDILTMDRVNEYMEKLGYKNIKLMRKMLDKAAVKEGRENWMCASEVGDALSRIAKGTFISEETSNIILDILEHQQMRSKLPLLVPCVAHYTTQKDKENLKEGKLICGHKTGGLSGTQHDVGIFTLPDKRRYVIAAFTNKLENDGEGVLTIAKISKLMYDAVKD